MRTSIISLVVLCVICVAGPCLAADTSSAAHPRAVNKEMVRSLALQPLALVEGDRCVVRGAVMAGTSPRANVRVLLISSSGKIYDAWTNAAGVYQASLPFAGTTTAYRERIADQIRVPTTFANQARVLRPAFVCSTKLTNLIFATQNKGT